MDMKISLIGGQFYQNVRRLLRHYWPGGTPPQTPDDIVQFSSVLTLDAPEREVVALHAPEDGEACYRMEVNHFGLLGMHGALPLRYTEWLIERRYRHGDESGLAFLDIFTQRVLSLRYQAWQKCRLYIQAERHAQAFLPAAIAAQLGQYSGKARLSVAADSVGLLATPARSLINLQHLLQREFSLPVEVIPFQTHWRTIDDAFQARLAGTALAMSPMLGSVYQDRQTRFIVRIGPVTVAQRANFVSGSAACQRLSQLVTLFSGPLLRFSLELLIRYDLCGTPLNGVSRLGWDGTLGKAGDKPLQRMRLGECHG